MPDKISDTEKTALLKLARAAMRDRLHADGSLDRELAGLDKTPILETDRATFVTLKTAGGGKHSLRGCIGNIKASEPLFRNVIENARRSAFNDPRFSPVTAEELPELEIEISVLTPMQPVDGADRIVAGRDGVELNKGAYGAVFLPQVATEQGWDVSTMLEYLALKAGLPRDGWRDADLSIFQAEVFGEGEPD